MKVVFVMNVVVLMKVVVVMKVRKVAVLNVGNHLLLYLNLLFIVLE